MAAIRQLFQPLGYPDQVAPIIRNADDGGLELVKARWRMPTPPQHLKTQRDPGVTNIRNFAGIETRAWRSVRKVKEVEITDDLFGFLTTSPSVKVAPIHLKAMPVILTQSSEWESWLMLPWPDARHLQRPLPDGALKLIEPPS